VTLTSNVIGDYSKVHPNIWASNYFHMHTEESIWYVLSVKTELLGKRGGFATDVDVSFFSLLGRAITSAADVGYRASSSYQN